MPRTYLKAVKRLKGADETQKLDKLNLKRMRAYREALSMLEEIQNIRTDGIYINNVANKKEQLEQNEREQYAENNIKSVVTPKPNEDLNVTEEQQKEQVSSNQLQAKKIIFHNQKQKESNLHHDHVHQSQGKCLFHRY